MDDFLYPWISETLDSKINNKCKDDDYKKDKNIIMALHRACTNYCV